MVSAPGRAWPRAYCGVVVGLGGAGARPPAGLIGSPAVLGLTVGLGDPWAYCRGVVVLGHTVGAWVPVGLLLGSVSTECNMSRYVRPARRSRWGSVHGAQLIRPTRPGWLWRGVDGSCQFRVCSCVLGRCTRSVGNAPLLFGCSAPLSGVAPLIGCSAPALVAAVGVVGACWA